MKKIIFIMCVCAGVTVCADTEEILATIEEATGWTAQELANGLAMLDRVYSNDCQSVAGRVRWHGKIVNTVFDTNTLTKTQYHEDGFVWSKQFDIAKPKSVQDQMTDAERKAAREQAAAKAEARRLAEKNARIALLTTNMTAEVTALMAQKQWPEELARLYLQDELNKLVGTNVVDVVIER